MAEKYKLCDDTLSQYLNWIGEIEDRIANQDIAQEDLDQLRNQINILKVCIMYMLTIEENMCFTIGYRIYK